MKQIIKKLLRENLETKDGTVFLNEPYDVVKKIIIEGRSVYVLFGDVDYYQNKEQILAIKKKSDKLSLDKTSYDAFLLEVKKRFNSVSELKQVDLLASIETTSPLTNEIGKIIGVPYVKHGFLKKDSNFKMRSIPLDKRGGVSDLFDTNFESNQENVIGVLDDFITTGSSFRNAFNLIPTETTAVGVCLFILKS